MQVQDFRGAGEPSGDEATNIQALKSADERARAAAADSGAALHYRLDAAAACPTAALSTGYRIPLVGLGTWKSEKGQVRDAVVEALCAGYRHVDAAAVYGNEEEVGGALAQVFSEGVVGRGDVFVTSKLWNADHGRARDACLKTLSDLKLDYLDLYLIHWPHSGRPGAEVAPPLSDTWAALEGLVSEGRVRSIGVSNFSVKKAEALIAGAKIMPAVLQVEAHPYWRNDALISWASSRGIHVTAYSPLGSPDSAAMMKRAADAPSLMKDPTLTGIAEKLGRSPAQVLICWAVQRGTSVLPKSVNPGRIRANFDAATSQLPREDFEALSRLETQMRMVGGDFLVDPKNGPYKSLTDLWDE
ncbi:MAG: low CO2-induced aldose reductase [Monoraphidium minutum]|nr:MAG: low CO2-induced aldose reductase [Monoraphidium minutum]